jgi:hypothetical protein
MLWSDSEEAGNSSSKCKEDIGIMMLYTLIGKDKCYLTCLCINYMILTEKC